MSLQEWPQLRSPRTIVDTVHGNIQLFHPIDVLVDTKEFQRLRGLKQLGLTPMVYPSGTHTRFSHSLGTYHLAFKLVDQLRRTNPDWSIDSQDHLCVAAAALLHDLGHGPFSHLFDGALREEMGNRMPKHEKVSVMLIERLFDHPKVKKAFEPYLGFGSHLDLNVQFICELVSSKRFDAEDRWLPLGRKLQKSFLYDIVSNDCDSLDVDKWDYLLRDSLSTGVGIGFNRLSADRLIENAWIATSEERPHHRRIAWFGKVETTLAEIGLGRQQLHERLYQHKVVRAIESLVVRAFQLASPHLLFRGDDGELFPLSRVTEDMGAFLRTNDSIYERILNSTEPELAEARQLLEAIENRQIPQELDSESFSPVKADSLANLDTNPGDNSDRKVEHMVKAELFCRLREQGIEAEESDIILITRVLHCGLGRTNPMEKVLLVDKNQNARTIAKEKILLKSAESSEIHWLGLYMPRGYPSSSLDQIKDTFDQILVDFGLRSSSLRSSPSNNQSSQ